MRNKMLINGAPAEGGGAAPSAINPSAGETIVKAKPGQSEAATVAAHETSET